MLRYHESRLVRAGFIGAVLVGLVVAVGLQVEQLRSLATDIRHQARFTDAGGLTAGSPVTLSGVKVGIIQSVSLSRGDALVTFTVNGKYRLGSETGAHIRTGTLLGQRVMTLESNGTGTLHASDVIPVARTSSPYSLTEAVSDLTTNTAGTDTRSVSESLDTLSQTLDKVAPQLGPTFAGLTNLSHALNSRNQSLRDLLGNAGAIAQTLSQRSQQVNTLLLDANDLLGVLVQRRAAVVNLLSETSALAKQLSGLVHDNEQTLAPSLQRLNSVLAMLQKNSENIAKALNGLAQYQRTIGEAANGGFYVNAYAYNFPPAQVIQPFLDYAFGFRRGVNAGQPPDTAGPRAEFPLPYNGIPGGSR